MKIILAALCSMLLVGSGATAQNSSNSEDHCEPEIHFEVPEFIEQKLSDGTMKRVGGVIIDTNDKQLVAWLRQGGQVAESASGLIEQVTRLSGTTNLALVSLVTGFTPFLNISMAGFSIIDHINGISAHEAELERIYDRVSEEFQRDREVHLAAALEVAENSLLVTDDDYSRAATVRVNGDLIEARRQLLKDLDIFYSAEVKESSVELALSTQTLAMRVCALGTRLQLNIGNEDAAKDLLSNCVSEQVKQTTRFVKKWLGKRRAYYFHESVDDEHFMLFLNLERWLRGKRDVLPEVVQENRKDFWVHDAIVPLDAPELFFQIDESPLYKITLPSAHISIENLQRLQGMALELESMCGPSFEEWEAFDGGGDVNISREDRYVLLVNSASTDTESDTGS